jgi:H+/Cl- antiporter ClcA
MENKKTKAGNELKMILFTVILGAVAGVVVWLFLKAVSISTGLLWEIIPGRISLPFYPLILCGCGGLILGIVHKLLGDYPEELKVVIAKIKRDKYYDYKPMAAILVSAFFPLIFGASVGHEAGLTGIIAGLCYWIGDNIKFAREDKERYNEIGAAVTLGVIFHAPLFGIYLWRRKGKMTRQISHYPSRKR